jgi:hypothetical protein
MDFELWQLPLQLWQLPLDFWQLPLELWQLPLELWQLPLELWLTQLDDCFCVLTFSGISSALSDSLIRQPHQTASSDIFVDTYLKRIRLLLPCPSAGSDSVSQEETTKKPYQRGKKVITFD